MKNFGKFFSIFFLSSLILNFSFPLFGMSKFPGTGKKLGSIQMGQPSTVEASVAAGLMSTNGDLSYEEALEIALQTSLEPTNQVSAEEDLKFATQESLTTAHKDQEAQRIIIDSALYQYSKFLSDAEKGKIVETILQLNKDIQEIIFDVLNTGKNIECLDMLGEEISRTLQGAINLKQSKATASAATSSAAVSAVGAGWKTIRGLAATGWDVFGSALAYISHGGQPATEAAASSAARPSAQRVATPLFPSERFVNERDETGARQWYQKEILGSLTGCDAWNANETFESPHAHIRQVPGLYQGWGPSEDECPGHTPDMCGFYAFFFACYFSQDPFIKQNLPVHISSLNNRQSFNALLQKAKGHGLKTEHVGSNDLVSLYCGKLFSRDAFYEIRSLNDMRIFYQMGGAWLGQVKAFCTDLKNIGNELKNGSRPNYTVILSCKVHPNNPRSEYGHWIAVNVTYNQEAAVLEFTIVDSIAINHTNDPDIVDLYNLLNGCPNGIWERALKS